MAVIQSLIIAFFGLAGLSPSSAQDILSDPGVAGPPVEIAHLYYDEWPTGIAVSSTGRKFSNYPPALDPTDSNYTVAELNSNTTEVPYPNAEINTPPGGRINYTTTPPTGANYQNYIIGSQSVVIDPADRLWILDTGRAATPNGTMVPASYGGPKLIGINLQNDSIFTTIVFSPEAAPSTSYLNDIRFDLTPSLTPSGQGIAYITDSSPEGTNAIVVVDLGAKSAWRHLINIPAVSATAGFVPTVWGQPIYSNGTNGQPIQNVDFGADGIALSADGATLYFSTTGGRELYAVPTERLRDNSPNSEILARASQVFLTGKGLTDGMESDSNNNIYMGNIEDNSISIYTPATGLLSTFVRDPRFSWTDTFSTATDGYLYFTENQLWRGAAYNGGVDRRVKPFVLFRVKLPDGGTKVTQPAP
ncbi:MAG: hypothetical protein M1820_002148 [Bogoriella megaspora]|nr:MAG: hypothetical protein M1820_002148 [Bogoriella megaspora]